MPGDETQILDAASAQIDPRLAQQNETVRQMEAAGFMAPAAADAPAAPPVTAMSGLPHP